MRRDVRQRKTKKGGRTMPQNPDVDNPKRAPSAGGVQASAFGSPISAESSATLRNSRMVKSRSRPQYIVAPRRSHGFAPLAVSPLAFNAVEEALRSSPDIEVIDTLGPKGVVGTLADGLSGSPNVIVARMEPEKAEMLAQQGQGQLIVESDQPLALIDTPFPQPPRRRRIRRRCTGLTSAGHGARGE